jgi:cytoskeletal protein CcmA (bactofilin family)
MDGTLIGETMKIKGEITSKETLQLNGELEGQVELDSRLTVGPKGKASANIKAKEVDIAGSVQGNIDAAERIVLRKGANLVGDVRTAGIVIEDGAYFKGSIDIVKPEPAKVSMPRPQQGAPAPAPTHAPAAASAPDGKR